MESDKAGKVWESGICDAETTAARGTVGSREASLPQYARFPSVCLHFPASPLGILHHPTLLQGFPNFYPNPH